MCIFYFSTAITFFEFSVQDYNEHLLKSGLQCLIGINCDAKNDVKSVQINDTTSISEVLNYGELLKESKCHLLMKSMKIIGN